jgi:hypothetical protein
MRPLDWPAIVATALTATLVGGLALYFSAYAPKEFSATERAASKQRNLANCGSGMFDVVPHDQFCPRYDAIALGSASGREGLTLHADGRAILVVGDYDEVAKLPAGRYEASVNAATFRELSNFVASFELDRRGSVQPPLAPPDPDGPADTPALLLRAGCKGKWNFEVNFGGDAGEVPAINACLLDFQRRADWSLLVDKPVVPAQ